MDPDAGVDRTGKLALAQRRQEAGPCRLERRQAHRAAANLGQRVRIAARRQRQAARDRPGAGTGVGRGLGARVVALDGVDQIGDRVQVRAGAAPARVEGMGHNDEAALVPDRFAGGPQGLPGRNRLPQQQPDDVDALTGANFGAHQDRVRGTGGQRSRGRPGVVVRDGDPLQAPAPGAGQHGLRAAEAVERSRRVHVEVDEPARHGSRRVARRWSSCQTASARSSSVRRSASLSMT